MDLRTFHNEEFLGLYRALSIVKTVDSRMLQRDDARN